MSKRITNMKNEEKRLAAIAALSRKGISLTKDYHELVSSEVELVLEWAIACKYRKPVNANGSRARMFWESLTRQRNK